MAVRARRRVRRVGLVPDSESDEDDVSRVVNDSLPNSEPIDLSDDEEMVGMASSPPRERIPQQQVPQARHPVEEILYNGGVRPRTEWLESCLSELAVTQPGFAGLPAATQAELCFGQFLMADLNVSGAASLPQAMHSIHNTELPGPFVLQVDEIINISDSLRGRYEERGAGPGRTLKLSMTDGVQRVFGLEYRPIGALHVFSPAGMKISLKNVCVKRGLLMLVPEVVEVLGGRVEHLESARLRAVQVINKPPRGRRTREGVVEPSLVEMATRAAWTANPEGSVASAGNNHDPTGPAVSNNGPGTRPSNSVNDANVRNLAREEVQQGREDRNMQYGPPIQSSGHSAHASHVHQSTRSTSVHQGGQQLPLQQDRFSHPREQSSVMSRLQSVGLESREATGHLRSVEQHEEVHVNVNVSGIQTSTVGNMHQVDQHTTRVQQGSGVESRGESMTNNTVQEVHVNSNLNMSGIHTSTVGHMHHVDQRTTIVQQGLGAETMTNTVQERTSSQVSTESNGRLPSTPNSGRPSLQSRRLVQSKLPTRLQRQAVEQPLLSTDGADVLIPMASDASQESRQNTPTDSRNPPSRVDTLQDGIPFTYLSVLKNRTNSQGDQIGVVRGKVKCVITGVTSFQYKDGAEFKLHMHIEDGSLMTTAFVQHQLVQRLVGYSPQEVIAGLKEPQTRRKMLDTMIRFQKFLERYEGIMEVEFPDPSSGVTVLQMTEGVQPSDVGLLFDRVHLKQCMQTPNANRLIPTIDLSTPP
ncbi:unnamed protein product [Calypogeia fissa]